MYIVTIKNNGVPTEIHGENQKLSSGSVVKSINAIDSFSFSMLPSNIGFDRIYERKTLVSVFNTSKNRYEFHGRVLYSNPSMSESGLIKLDAVCESYLGFLYDSEQEYVDTQNWTVTGLLQHIIDCHNSQVEEYKRFSIGEVTVTDPNDNLYIGIQRKNTFETIKEKLIDKLGGELQFRVIDDVIYLDYLTAIGEPSNTEIALSRNMKAIAKEKDPSAYVTRLIPLGCKLTREETSTDEEGNETTQTIETEERLDISSVNNGVKYIVDETAEAVYGINVRSVEWDDVTTPAVLKTKGQKWLIENNKVQIKYSITALDLSLLGLDIDDYNIGNTHPVKNALIGIDDVARIIKKTIDICEDTKSKIEVGDSFKTLSDLQAEQSGKIETVKNTVEKIESDYVTNQALYSETTLIHSLIKQTADNISLQISETYVSKSDDEEYKQIIESQMSLLSEQMSLKFTETIQQIENVNGDLQTKFNTITKYFTFDINGLTIGQVDNPNRVVIDNDQISILVNGIPVQEFKADGTALIPILKVTTSLNLFGLQITEDANNINCDFAGVY